jgi:phosphoesterase RecJ-like protein
MPGSTETAVLRSGRAAVLEQLRALERAVVVTHERPDGDALGSLLGMHELLLALGHDSVMFVAESDLPLPSEYRFLPLQGVITQPPADVASRTVIFVDCGNIERNPAAERLRPSEGWGTIINVDHHHDNSRFGSVNYVDPSASCTAEMVWELAHALEVPIDTELAVALYVGLITDTGCFMYENTSPRAHLMAAELIEAGVDVHAIYQQVYEDIPFAKLALLARGLANVQRYDEDRLTVAYLSAEDFAAAGAQESYAEGVIDHLRAVRGTAVAALARDRLDGGSATPDGGRQRKVSLRAADTRLDVSAIARLQGGGGHRAAAGFSTSLSWEDLVTFLRNALAAQLRDLPAET